MNFDAFCRALLLGVALLVAMPLSAAARCRQIGEPLLVIDGRQHTAAELSSRNLSRDSVEASYSYYCWNPADSVFHWSRGPRDLPAGFAVIRIVTKGLVDRLVAELYRVSDAGNPPTVRSATDDEILVELNADKTQWSATLKHGAMVHRCVRDVGTPSPSTASERQRTCVFSITEGEKYVLSTEG